MPQSDGATIDIDGMHVGLVHPGPRQYDGRKGLIDFGDVDVADTDPPDSIRCTRAPLTDTLSTLGAALPAGSTATASRKVSSRPRAE